MRKMIYFDNNATTEVAPQVLDAMLPYLSTSYGNPSSSHFWGRETRVAIETARSQVAELINADPSEIVFTSGGTESDNSAIVGSLAARPDMDHIVTTRVEHEAVRNLCQELNNNGTSVTFLDVDKDGLFDLDALRRALTRN